MAKYKIKAKEFYIKHYKKNEELSTSMQLYDLMEQYAKYYYSSELNEIPHLVRMTKIKKTPRFAKSLLDSLGYKGTLKFLHTSIKNEKRPTYKIQFEKAYTYVKGFEYAEIVLMYSSRILGQRIKGKVRVGLDPSDLIKCKTSLDKALKIIHE